MTAWDPEKGEIYSRSHWRVTEVKVNTNLPMSLFRPRIPDGTRVLDGFSGRQYFQGGKRRNSAKQKPSGAPPIDAQRVSGAPQPSFWKKWAVPLLLALSMGLSIGAYCVHRRMRRTDS